MGCFKGGVYIELDGRVSEIKDTEGVDSVTELYKIKVQVTKVGVCNIIIYVTPLLYVKHNERGSRRVDDNEDHIIFRLLLHFLCFFIHNASKETHKLRNAERNLKGSKRKWMEERIVIRLYLHTHTYIIILTLLML